MIFFFFFSSRRRHTRWPRDWSSDVCSSDLGGEQRPDEDVVGEEGVIAGAQHRHEERGHEDQPDPRNALGHGLVLIRPRALSARTTGAGGSAQALRRRKSEVISRAGRGGPRGG